MVSDKIKEEKGSAMILAIIVLILSTMIMFLLSKQVLNQIKMTKNTQESIISKYEIYAGRDICIADILDKIKVDVDEHIYIEPDTDKEIIKKIVTVDYPSKIYIAKDKNYNISIQTDKVNEGSDKHYNISSDPSGLESNEGKYKVELIGSTSLVKSVDIEYKIVVSHLKSNIKENSFNVKISLENIIDAQKYGIKYEINKI